MGRAPASPISFASARIAVITLLFVWPAGAMGFAQSPAKASVDQRTATVEGILADYRDEQNKREPERASLTGDKRYNDQLSDFSASAANNRVERVQTYIQRLSEIDNAGLPEKTRAAANSLLNKLIEEQNGDAAKSWQMPLDQFLSLHTQLLALAEKLSFDNVKDYDDYLARLKKIPRAFSQIMTNVQLAADSGRVLPPAGVVRVLAQVKSVAEQPAETSPFAAPLKRFPATVAAADRQRISTDVLDAIGGDVIPGYQRIGRFVAARSKSASVQELAPAR